MPVILIVKAHWLRIFLCVYNLNGERFVNHHATKDGGFRPGDRNETALYRATRQVGLELCWVG